MPAALTWGRFSWGGCQFSGYAPHKTAGPRYSPGNSPPPLNVRRSGHAGCIDMERGSHPSMCARDCSLPLCSPAGPV